MYSTEFIYKFFFPTGNIVFTLVVSSLLAHVLISQQKVIILSDSKDQGWSLRVPKIFDIASRVGFTCPTCLMCVLFFPDFCEGSDDSDSLNRSFTCRMKCTLNHGGGFYKVIIVPVVTQMLYI